MEDSNYRPVSISRLYSGLVVKGDILDAYCTKLLVKGGVVLDEKIIGTISKLNNGKETVFVSTDLHVELIGETLPFEIENRVELEKNTGYSDVKDKTFELLSQMAKNETIQQETLISVADELSHRLEVATPSKIATLINALAPVDEYLQRHCVNLGLLNGLLGRWLNLPKEQIDNLVLIGLLHDCGKALLPAQVLSAPRKLTIAEFEVVKMHPVYTYKLLTDFSENIKLSASSHHERVNGTGYPNRLSSGEIALEARITAISDIYDAVVSQRAYKKPRSPFNVMAMLIGLRDTDLDAELVGIFNENMQKQLIGKPVMMSNGAIGVIRSCDPNDIEYPIVEIKGEQLKTNEHLHCTSMFTEEDAEDKQEGEDDSA